MPLVACPHCKKRQILRRELIGFVVACERCAAEFTAKTLTAEDEIPYSSTKRDGVRIIQILAGLGLTLLLAGFAAGVIYGVLEWRKEPVNELREVKPGVEGKQSE